jgi:hypothetical protein
MIGKVVIKTVPQKVQKPHKWRKRKDAELCIECDKEFKQGDMVYDDVAVNLHAECLASYKKTLKHLGLFP